jgi:hypothetical protein
MMPLNDQDHETLSSYLNPEQVAEVAELDDTTLASLEIDMENLETAMVRLYHQLDYKVIKTLVFSCWENARDLAGDEFWDNNFKDYLAAKTPTQLHREGT